VFRGGASLLAAALALALLGPATLVAAEARAGAAELSEARVRFERGLTAYRAGELKQALADFVRAYELAPSPELEFNLARVYERMGEAEPAIRHYRSYLASDALSPRERAQIEARIQDLIALQQRQQAQVKAPPPSTDALTAEARAFFERGLTLFRKRQYEAALVAFSAARKFAVLPELAYNLALTSERLGRSAEAADYYRAYLREAKSPKDAERVQARVKALLSERAPRARNDGRR
jgi:tetratricopeptide (TPR) repeat protein